MTLSWEQVNAWRMQQHYLLNPADREQMLDVLKAIGGVQAQVMSAAELALSARIQRITPDDVQSALWTTRTLVKSWIWRGTLHLVAADDYPTYVAGLSTLRHFRRASWQKYHGVTLVELEAIIEAVNTTLTDTGITREQLADAVAARTGSPKLLEILRSGWGAVLKPVAFQGHLCFGPSQGQNITFVNPARWIGRWTSCEPEEALKMIARLYINAYGPATIDDFDHWVGLEPSDVKRIFKTLADAGEIEPVDVEGWKAWALTRSLEPIVHLKATQSVRLLPNFDPYTIAVSRHSQHILDAKHKGRVYRPQGWISPVVLVDGRMIGVWEYDKQRSKIVVTVNLFEPPTDEIKHRLEAEALRVGEFLGGQAELIFQ